MALPQTSEVKLSVKPIYSKVNKTFTSGGAATTNWDDQRILDLENYEVKTMDQKEIYKHVEKLFPKLETGISERDIVMIINLAWNLLAPGKVFKRLFPEKSAANLLTSLSLDDADTDVIMSNVHQTKFALSDTLETCQAGTYICASLLRLVTKSEENYRKAGPEVQKAYPKLYQKSFPINGFLVRDPIISTIHMSFASKALLRNSLNHLLYHIPDVKDNQGVIELTFKMHIEDTGMHCWPMFKEICGEFNADTATLLTALHIRPTARALAVIATLITDFEADETVLKSTKRDKKTYHYARIYDKNMFADLQTKNCRPLALILGNLKKMTVSRGSGDVLDMVALKTLDQGVKDLYAKFAKGIYDYFNASKLAAEDNPIFEALTV
ncbi:TPA_asm: nucleocapsid protein [Taxus virus 1]|uniref:Nucleoprotein n=1 Tax=Taxus virus 1 TaxID=2977994 RepID=A0A9N6YJF9_9RHAB|nr:TPA_asm: nucleocapsid protein [Taxus virus 1]